MPGPRNVCCPCGRPAVINYPWCRTCHRRHMLSAATGQQPAHPEKDRLVALYAGLAEKGLPLFEGLRTRGR